MAKIPKYLLNLAGEYRVASELTKRGIFATVTYGNHKAVDVYAISDRYERAVRIEVKTTQANRFVTSIGQKEHRRAMANLPPDDPAAPDFWVLVHVQPRANDTFDDRFFILSHEEIREVQQARNNAYASSHDNFDVSTGVDNVLVTDVERFAGQWFKIVERMAAGPFHCEKPPS